MAEEEEMMVEALLERLYTDPSLSSAAFAGVDALWREAQKHDHSISKRQVREFLSSQRTYTVHHPRRVRLPRSKLIADGYMTHLHADLAVLLRIREENDQMGYLLVACDVLSKRVFAEPVRTKEPKEMIRAFKAIFGRMEILAYSIFTDKGTEFTSKEMRRFFKRMDINKYEPNSSTVKASLAENCIRRIKQRLYRYMTENRTQRWVDVLQQVVDGINHSKSRVLGGLCPADVSFHNAREVRELQYGPVEAPIHAEIQRTPRHKPGDLVKMSLNKPMFAKEHKANFDDEYLVVDRVKPARMPYDVPVYKVKDEAGDMFNGYFLEQDLQRVRKKRRPEWLEIVEELERKKDNEGMQWYFVRFRDDPTPYWISDSHFAE